MAKFRLLNVSTLSLETYPLDSHPPYIAASHTWSEQVFPFNQNQGFFSSSFGGKGIRTVLQQLYPHIRHCWIDTLCINQSDETDKLVQIPLMGRIFGQAEVVVIFISAVLGATQADVDELSSKLEGALAMCQADAWAEEGANWTSDKGKQLIVHGMNGLMRLASTAWATRVWTLQEYVLAQKVVWIGTDLEPLILDDFLLSALPDICNTLNITECLGSDMRVLYAHFEGMANVRLGSIERKRITELLGNRTASVAVDEVYGVMAASGVEIGVVTGETKYDAWRRWCEEAVRQGHVRWLLLPRALEEWSREESPSCIFAPFNQRHRLSAASSLDRVEPLGPITIEPGGGIAVYARPVGRAQIIRCLGRVYEAKSGRLHRDMSLILFARAKWKLVLQLISAFGGGRYDFRRAKAIARVLTGSYIKALKAVHEGSEEDFRPLITNQFQLDTWNDFMSLQQSQMIGMNEGVGYLCRVVNDDVGAEILTVLVAGETIPENDLGVLDFEARSPDGRSILMVVTPMKKEERSLHKVGMTLPVSDAIAKLWTLLPISEYSIGGHHCDVCKSTADNMVKPQYPAASSMDFQSETTGRHLKILERMQQRSVSLSQRQVSKQPDRSIKNTLRQRKLRASNAHMKAMLAKLTGD